MSSGEYVPPDVWVWDASQDGPSSNRPTAGARTEKELPKGEHALQLYSMATPNGQKIPIFLEELLAVGVKEAEYDAWLIHIGKGDQFGSGFTNLNPNGKIPALYDYSQSPPAQVFETGSILIYLAEKFAGQHPFFPPELKTKILNWLFWQVGSAPYMGGGFGHFYHFAKVKQEYPINRFTMEAKRQLDVLNNQLKDNKYIVGDVYTIADIAIFTWYGGVALNLVYGGAKFLNVEQDYPHVLRWARELMERPAVKRGRLVNKVWGDEGHIPERHSAEDIDKVVNK